MPNDSTAGDMPPKLETLYRRLLADGASWSSDLPSTATLEIYKRRLVTDHGETRIAATTELLDETPGEIAIQRPISVRVPPPPS